MLDVYIRQNKNHSQGFVCLRNGRVQLVQFFIQKEKEENGLGQQLAVDVAGGGRQ